MPVEGENTTRVASPAETSTKSAEHQGAMGAYQRLKEKGVSHVHPDMPKNHDGNFKSHPLAQ